MSFNYSYFLVLFLLCSAAHAVEVTDQRGCVVDVPDDVRRVVSIPIPLASMIMALDGGAQRLVGMNSASQTDFRHGLLGRLYPGADQTPSGIAGDSFMPNAEAIAVSKPDVVFQWGDRGEDIITPIAQLGIPVITLRYGESILAGEWLRLVGKVLGKEERGIKLSKWFTDRYNQLGERAASIAEEEKPRVVYLFRARSGLQVAGQNTSMDSDIRLVGGRNMAADLPGFAPIDIEQLMHWDPQVILLNNFETDLTPSELLDDLRLQDLAAIKDQRVYRYPHGGFRWDPPSQETPLTLDWLFSLLHPEKSEPGFRQRVNEAYSLLYGYTLKDTDYKQLLQQNIHSGSAHYQRLFFGEQP